jgi:ABC-type antimicrobial peptide transport system permease subunit
MLVAACSLTVAAVGAIAERRRPFALLRAAGMRVAELRGVVLLETALPLAAAVAASAVLGLVAAAAISNASGQPWQPPGIGYPLATLAALMAAGAVTALTLPLIDLTTRPHDVRFT